MKLQLIQTIALFGSLATAMPFMSISITITEEGTPASADVSSRPVHEKVSKKAHEPVLLPKNAGGARCYLLCEPSGEKANCPSDMVRESHNLFLPVVDNDNDNRSTIGPIPAA